MGAKMTKKGGGVVTKVHCLPKVVRVYEYL